MVTLETKIEIFPLRQRFSISRGSKTETVVVTVELRDGEYAGRGECGPNIRYDETPESVADEIAAMAAGIEGGLDRDGLQQAMPPGAARNALDCAFWDLQAKQTGQPVWALAGLAKPVPVETAFTLSVDTPVAMAEAARANASRPLLKLKLTGAGDLDRVRAVRQGAPDARLIVDANEAWTPADFTALATELAGIGVEMIEQPLPAGDDAALAALAHPVPICADESCHDRASVAELVDRYDMINIKLDKAGGLTEALATAAVARAVGLDIMVGCMVGTSLAMAPAHLVAQAAKIVDLDGPLLLAEDREPSLEVNGSRIFPPTAALWG
ncbi:MAG: L-alanine-DL-glutamate epimerase-like enolase superfamily enzyme [Alphaproteobacteria bacterium]|jgi:L-alanine-DL-glutamate epimerase-like enolase superfamily enzyme